MQSKYNYRTAAFTLVEVVMSTAIMAVLMAGIASAVLMTSRAMPEARDPADAVLDGSQVADRIASDLLCAQSFTIRTPHEVEFTVADRTRDDVPETIRYAWAGTSGDPLTWQYNGGSVVSLVDDVREFELSYDLTTVTEQPPPESNESPEQELARYDGAVSPADYALTAKEWVGQYFMPTLPADATEWSVTRVKIMARVHGATKGVTAIELRLPTGANLPGPSVIESVPMYESSLLDGYLWQEFSFSNTSGLSPTQGLTLVLTMITRDTHLADVQYDVGGGAGLLVTTNAGSSWTYDAGKAMLYYIYGTVTTETTPDPVTREWLDAVGITLRVGDASSARVDTAVQILNRPEVTAP
jgi:type II secretory pathway pseudopilin PulG